MNEFTGMKKEQLEKVIDIMEETIRQLGSIKNKKIKNSEIAADFYYKKIMQAKRELQIIKENY
jgi:hypothetical protein